MMRARRLIICSRTEGKLSAVSFQFSVELLTNPFLLLASGVASPPVQKPRIKRHPIRQTVEVRHKPSAPLRLFRINHLFLRIVLHHIGLFHLVILAPGDGRPCRCPSGRCATQSRSITTRVGSGSNDVRFRLAEAVCIAYSNSAPVLESTSCVTSSRITSASPTWTEFASSRVGSPAIQCSRSFRSTDILVVCHRM